MQNSGILSEYESMNYISNAVDIPTSFHEP